jgi:hypothetical protein
MFKKWFNRSKPTPTNAPTRVIETTVSDFFNALQAGAYEGKTFAVVHPDYGWLMAGIEAKPRAWGLGFEVVWHGGLAGNLAPYAGLIVEVQ